jgi:hypothetical protein
MGRDQRRLASGVGADLRQSAHMGESTLATHSIHSKMWGILSWAILRASPSGATAIEHGSALLDETLTWHEDRAADSPILRPWQWCCVSHALQFPACRAHHWDRIRRKVSPRPAIYHPPLLHWIPRAEVVASRQWTSHARTALRTHLGAPLDTIAVPYRSPAIAALCYDCAPVQGWVIAVPAPKVGKEAARSAQTISSCTR